MTFLNKINHSIKMKQQKKQQQKQRTESKMSRNIKIWFHRNWNCIRTLGNVLCWSVVRWKKPVPILHVHSKMSKCINSNIYSPQKRWFTKGPLISSKWHALRTQNRNSSIKQRNNNQNPAKKKIINWHFKWFIKWFIKCQQ